MEKGDFAGLELGPPDIHYKKDTSVMIRVCHGRSHFLSCMYIHDKFFDRIKIVIPVLS